MINLISSRLILRNNSPLFDEKKYHPSNKIGVLLNDNVIKVNEGSALDEFINEREEIKEKIKKLNEQVSEKVIESEEDKGLQEEKNDIINMSNSENSNEDDKDIKKLEEKLKKVDKLITGYEKGFLVNSTDEDIQVKSDGMSLLA